MEEVNSNIVRYFVNINSSLLERNDNINNRWIRKIVRSDVEKFVVIVNLEFKVK